MKDFKSWGKRRRVFKDKNYDSIWYNLTTLRLGLGNAIELEPDKSEFYDVGINTRCNANCPWCYTNANKNGENWSNICETWKKWMLTFPKDEKIGNITYTEKPFQIAIGSTGEPTIHPDFPEFLKTVYETGVVPNYTTNGVLLTDKVLEYTRNYCGAVAVSLANRDIEDKARKSIEKLLKCGNIKVVIHHIISDKDSVDRMMRIGGEYGTSIHYHVLLPLMKHGRSSEEFGGKAVFEYLEDQLTKSTELFNIAFGANFADYLKDSKIKTWLYPPESLSKNIILKPGEVIITPSSFNLKPCKIIKIK